MSEATAQELVNNLYEIIRLQHKIAGTCAGACKPATVTKSLNVLTDAINTASLAAVDWLREEQRDSAQENTQ